MVYLLENTLFPPGGWIAADVIWGENMKREREKKGERKRENKIRSKRVNKCKIGNN
jgi:hypothetical protein